MKKNSYFLISLDFELMWGMFDKVTPDTYGANITGVRAAIPEMLALFRHHDIHATWATVGMLMYEDAEALAAAMPPETDRPSYIRPELSSYTHFLQHVKERPELRDYYFAPELVREIQATPHQELASHTFSHYYCLDGGEAGEASFAADCAAMNAAAAKLNVSPTSIIFPRNQTTPEALAVVRGHGITCYRGTETSWLYRARKEAEQTNFFVRACRLLDHYVNFSGHHTYILPEQATDLPVNLPASRFLRPYSRTLRVLEPLRLRRIKKAMTHAAKHNEVFHLWWHPHNFGVNRKDNLENLKTIIEHYHELHTQYGMQSANMHELATRVRE